MWSNRDQLQAYQFLRQRSKRSLVVATPNSPERPDRRLVVSVLVGTAAALLALAVLAVIGIIRPGNAASWRDGRAVIVEKETGTRFVMDDDGVLHQALNYASAALFVGSPEVRTVSRASLDDVPRGPRVGIPGAPDSLPARTGLRSGAWTVCSRTTLEQGRAGSPELVVQVSAEPSAPPVPAGAAVLVQASGRSLRHLVAEGRRHLVRDDRVLAALGVTDATPVPVSAGWLNAVPAGPDLEFLSVAGTGEPLAGAADSAVRVGEVYEVQQVDGGRVVVVVAREGLAPVGHTAAQLIVANPAGAGQDRVGSLSAADATRLPQAVGAGPGEQLPDRLPRGLRISGRQVALCATVAPGSGSDGVRLRVLPDIDAPRSAPAQRQGEGPDDGRSPRSDGTDPPAAGAVSVAPG
ncbi:MAG: type VII secretion protein EccB, partial [Phycicoccus sp.]